MRGYIVKRGNDSYRIAVSLGKGPDGKYKQHFETVRGNKKAADKRLSEILSSLDNGVFVKPGKQTLGDYLRAWLKDYCQANITPQSTQTYQFFIERHIIPAIGHVPLTDLRPQHLAHLYSEKLSSGSRDGKGGLGLRSTRYIHTTLHKALSNALKIGLIARNPASAVEAPKQKRREMQTMNESDIHIFLELARSTPYHALFYTLLFTGMRRSEILALRWFDMDLLLCQLSVTRTIHRLHNGEIIYGEPKTGKSKRLVSLSPSNAIVIREHREAQEKLRQSLGMTLSDDDLVFCHYDGKPYLPDSITQAWRKLAHRCGLKGIRLHDARHTHASLMLKQGVHPKIVQERLGHASISITLDTYSHVAPGLQQAAANGFDNIVMPKQKDTVKTL